MPRLQDIIYRFEVGSGTRLISRAFIAIALLVIVVAYNLRAFQNMSTQEAMDMAQLGRNIAEGHGYSTLFIRPLSMHLLTRDKASETNRTALTVAHPDIANPPAYPLILAGLMKTLPFNFAVGDTKQFWSRDGRFQPDFLISLFNQLLLLVVVMLTFLLANKLFDPVVAWLSAIALLGADTYWRFAVSGLSTTFLLLITMILVWVLVYLEQESREPRWGKSGYWLLAIMAGLLLGVGALTRYSFAWMSIPVAVYTLLIGSKGKRWAGTVSALICILMMAPWLMRNVQLSGVPFGVCSFVAFEDSRIFPEHKLQRSLQPNFSRPDRAGALWDKFTTNSRKLLQDELPGIGGTWVGPFFIVGLLVLYRKPSTTRLHYLTLGAIALMAVVQTAARTQLSDDSPIINSENLLILFGPIVVIFGVSLFFLLLDQLSLPGPQVRYLIIGVFACLACTPFLFTVFGGSRLPLAYPPYKPDMISFFAAGVDRPELTMSDIPWAVAWYGQRQSVWMTLRAYSAVGSSSKQELDSAGVEAEAEKDTELILNEDIGAIRDTFGKRIVAIYLSPFTTQGGILGKEDTWANFAVLSFMGAIPKELGFAYVAKLSTREHIMIADFKRWPPKRRTVAPESPAAPAQGSAPKVSTVVTNQ